VFSRQPNRKIQTENEHIGQQTDTDRHTLHNYLIYTVIQTNSYRNVVNEFHKYIASINITATQWRRLPEWGLQTPAIGPQFSGDLISRHPGKHRPSYSRHCPQSSSVWAFYVALSILTLPLRHDNVYGLSLPIRPFQGSV